MVLDEAHTIKSTKSQISVAAAALIADYRWCLTGTPIQVTPLSFILNACNLTSFDIYSFFCARLACLMHMCDVYSCLCPFILVIFDLAQISRVVY